MSSAALPFEVELHGAQDTEALGARLAPLLAPGDVILLEGPLGAGKTTLVRGLVAALGGDATEVCSPTFVLLESYAVEAGPILRVHHADLYRLRGRPAAPLDEVGLGDCLEDPAAITAIEWPESWPWLPSLGVRALGVRLEFAPNGRCAAVAARR